MLVTRLNSRLMKGRRYSAPAVLILTLGSIFLANPLRSQQPPVINSFSASPTVTNPGLVTNLSWSVSNATSVSIDQGVGDVIGQSSVYVSPTRTTTYTLTASAGAASLTQPVTITVADTAAPAFGNGQTYYVSPTGSDSNSGLSAGSPWKTVAKVNSSNFQPGDTVLFQRGGEWRESLTVPSSGAAGNPITFADYGSGAKPKFWGSVVLNNALFVPAGGGLYTYSIATVVSAALVNHVFFYTSPSNNAAGLVNSWSYSGSTLTINSPDSDPRADGKVYTAVVRSDVVFSNFKNHLVFRNLVVDESAQANQGYAFRVQNSTDVVVDSCEAYRAGKHHFASINSTQFVGKNLYAAWAMPGQSRVGASSPDPAVSAYVSYGDTSFPLPNQTSEWRNCVWDHPVDPQNSVNYYAFYTHGAEVTSVLLDNMSSLDASLAVSNTDNPAASITIEGGLVQNGRLEVSGQGILVDGMHVTGPLGSVDMLGANLTFQNMILEGSYLETDGYQSAVMSRNVGNTLRFSTIVLDARAAPAYSCVTLDSNFSGSSTGAQFKYYGNICTSPGTALKQWNVYSPAADFATAQYNLYAPGAAFEQATGGGFSQLTLGQWQGYGVDTNSLQGDPLFTDAAHGNYGLQAGSPAIDAALLPVSLLAANPPIFTDYAGNARLEGSAFDIGALEYPGTQSIPGWTVSATAGSLQRTTVNSPFAVLLQATVADAGNHPVSGVPVTFTTPGSGAGAIFGSGATATVTTNGNGIATAPVLTANGQIGSYMVTASAPAIATAAGFSLTNNPAPQGALTGSVDSATTAANLTVEGSTDWVHWGDASLTRKAGVGAQISTYAVVGGGSVLTYANDPRPLNWTDGSPTVSGTNNLKGIYVNGSGKGFSITAPADTTVRTLIVHVGGWNSGGMLTAHLSNSSAADYTNTTAVASGQYDRNYTLVYQAGAAGQSLLVTWKMTSGSGNVTLNGAAMSAAGGVVPNIAATGGALQTTNISTAFLSPLQATVKDASSIPISGAAVTFTAPGSGASGTFGGSGTAVTVNTDATGVAAAPVFTANTVAGSYTVMASTPGAASTASFNLTNHPGAPASIAATGGNPQSATVNTAFGAALQVTVKDSGGNLVSGATVTFTAPGSGAGGAFAGGFTMVDVMTIANGTATSPIFTANGTAGAYVIASSVTGAPSASFNLTNNPVVVGGSLAVVGDTSKTGAALSSEGAVDWVHWGDASLNRKAGVAAQISTYTIVGGGAATKYSNDPRPLNWTGGSPTATGTNDLNGLYISGTGKGFSITAPADTTIRTLVVHVGGWNSGGTLTAHLSDGSAADFVNTTSTVSGQYDRNYTLTYSSGAAGKTLTVTWKMASGSGNVTLNGAAMQ